MLFLQCKIFSFDILVLAAIVLASFDHYIIASHWGVVRRLICNVMSLL